MLRTRANKTRRQRGMVAVMLAILMIPIFAMVAFAVDYGLLTAVKTELHRAAEGAALAAVLELAPDSVTGAQNESAARATAAAYVGKHSYKIGTNTTSQLTVLPSQIEVGQLNRATVYPPLLYLGPYPWPQTINTVTPDPANGIFLDTVRVTITRDGSSISNPDGSSTANNPRVNMVFANLFGIQRMAVGARATAMLRSGASLIPIVGTDIIPITVSQTAFDAAPNVFSMYGGNPNNMGNTNDALGPGNWGQVDVGDGNNSASDLVSQIEDGLRQQDLDALMAEGRQSQNQFVETPINLNGDTGFNANLERPLENLVGSTRAIPIYDTAAAAGGDNQEFHIIRWELVKIIEVDLTGQPASRHLTVEKVRFFYGHLSAVEDISGGGIPGVFTSPALIE